MNEQIKYTVFKTKWGYFGLVANKKGLLRTCLPCPNSHFIKHRLLTGLDNPQFDQNLLRPLQDEVIAYFKGKPVRFGVPLALDGLAPFVRKVLTACRKIPSGKTVSYSQLAKIIGKPGASRAVGNALAKNPIPLIIPCHRVIRHDGSLGNFSAIGGTILKKRLLTLERS
jgi:methylated-DNA-[protein]-cysteine S-methyltransferase